MMDTVLTDAAALQPRQQQVWAGWYVVGAALVLALGAALGASAKPLAGLMRRREK